MTLNDEEISDVNLAAFRVFDKENAGRPDLAKNLPGVAEAAGAEAAGVSEAAEVAEAALAAEAAEVVAGETAEVAFKAAEVAEARLEARSMAWSRSFGIGSGRSTRCLTTWGTGLIGSRR
jgi:hypothetical protein